MTGRKRPTNADSGSPSDGEPDYLVVGILRRPHGLRGEMVMQVMTDFPERLLQGVEVTLGKDHRKLVIESTRPHAEGMLIRFRGIDTPEAARSLRNQSVFVPAADRPSLPDGHYYYHDILGCSVEDEQGHTLGVLLEILRTGANDVYVVQAKAGREILLPAITDVIIGIDITRRLIRVRVPAGIEFDPEDQRPSRLALRHRSESTSGRHGRR